MYEQADMEQSRQHERIQWVIVLSTALLMLLVLAGNLSGCIRSAVQQAGEPIATLAPEDNTTPEKPGLRDISAIPEVWV